MLVHVTNIKKTKKRRKSVVGFVWGFICFCSIRSQGTGTRESEKGKKWPPKTLPQTLAARNGGGDPHSRARDYAR